MKGLLLKDFYLLWRYYKLYFIVIMIMLGLSFYQPFFLAYPVFFAAIVVISLTSMDEKRRWQLYTAVLPCSRKMIVLEKYLLAAILLVPITILCLLISLIPSQIFREYPSQLSTIMTIFCGSIVLISIFLPAQICLGAERARIFYLVLSAVTIGGFTAFYTIVTEDHAFLFPQSPTFWCAAIGAFTILAVLLSMLISIKVYQKKELV